jgi:hypothetical protein
VWRDTGKTELGQETITWSSAAEYSP